MIVNHTLVPENGSGKPTGNSVNHADLSAEQKGYATPFQMPNHAKPDPVFAVKADGTVLIDH